MIRLATLADVPEILEIYKPYILHTAITFEYDIPTLSQFEARFLDVTSHCPWLVWEENGAVLGYAYAHPAFERAAYQWAADLAIYLAPEAQGKGIGKGLYQTLTQLLTKQGYRLAYGVVTSANEKSCRFHEALGFVKQAQFPDCGYKFNQWYGTIWYEKRLSEDPPTEPPIPFPQLKGELL